ncbi:hypothetical protein FE810_14655 [Thalassotalea litorea]|uniref:Uncharacterized protein n=1 Tax=Thalassotalea litorea TaxID=2020715 RepID=A0A5R9ID15_9GAMM|nr:hypothetical protein [Thalassotalea litorea]TLU61475.1 hypothetical protein FE810_14655 [Thalassotalea litorea]
MKALLRASRTTLLTGFVLLSGCSVGPEYEYRLSGHYDDLWERQILDPAAPVTNAGIVNTLNGEVATNVMTGYEKSVYAPTTARKGTGSFSGKSGSGSGKN